MDLRSSQLPSSRELGVEYKQSKKLQSPHSPISNSVATDQPPSCSKTLLPNPGASAPELDLSADLDFSWYATATNVTDEQTVHKQMQQSDNTTPANNGTTEQTVHKQTQ